MLAKLFKRIIYKLARRKFVRGFDTYCQEKTGRALMYYKTEKFLLGEMFQDFSHPNNWESFEMAKILNELGFVVDILDRTAGSSEVERIKDEYDIFIGIGAGNSGKQYSSIAKRLPSAIKVLYALGPEPELGNKTIIDRYNYFFKRHPDIHVEMRRLYYKININEVVGNSDFIFINGGEFTKNSYSKFNKDIFRVFSSSHPGLDSKPEEVHLKKQNKFLFFGGGGNFTKGLDLAIEAFSQLPNLELYIGAPDSEEEFNKIYLPIVEKSKNIHFLGFIKIGSNLFNKVTSECGYVILPSCSDGCPTSVTTCMRRGLIPVVTYETGLDVGDFGYLIKDIGIDSLAAQVLEISKEPREEFNRRSLKTYAESFQYTRENFSKTFRESVQAIMKRLKNVSK